jgi:hypothetical protein
VGIEVAIYNHGSIVQFEPLIERAEEWFDEHIRSEPWQWLGGRLCVDHRYADELAIGLQKAGFVVSLF